MEQAEKSKGKSLLRISTTRFGDISIDEARVIQMRDGMLGFDHLKRYALLMHGKKIPFSWLQSIEDGSIAFVVINAFVVKPDYEPVISDDEVKLLEIASPEDAVLFSVVTIRSDPFKVTANLRAPIVINAKKMLAKQVVLVESDYSVHYPITENKVFLEEKAYGKAEIIPSALAM
ncbi:MAG: flagellar assembly factor FliW [Desulfobacteraceae bacterium Eth-SRB1]|nr:MAG: flagellar assembly factor FliW [Desulfobacteraceae bacterium Eth-SRB1]